MLTTAMLFSPLILLVVVVLGLGRTVGEGDEAETRMIGVIPDDEIDRDVGLDRFFRSFGALSVGIGCFFCCSSEDDNDDCPCCSCCCCCVSANCCEGG